MFLNVYNCEVKIYQLVIILWYLSFKSEYKYMK